MSFNLFTLALCFIVFICQAARIPTIYEYTETIKEFASESIVMGTYNIPIHTFDALVKKHEDKLESWGYITNQAYNKLDLIFYS